MPEFKRTFTGGKMEKDLDERMVPNGSYREALNIEVATSEGSNVGAAENVLGNIQITEAINGPDYKYMGENRYIAITVDQETDMLYRFVNTESTDLDPAHMSSGVWMDRIVEYDTTKSLSTDILERESPVMVDIWKVRTHCVDEKESECLYPMIKVYENYAQLRPFMSLMVNESFIDIEKVYIQNIIYGSDGNGDYAWLTLNKHIPDQSNNCIEGQHLYFVADRVLNFHPDRSITGLNIMDGMIFWTDDHSEPKKVHIKRSKLGCSYLINPFIPEQFNYAYRHFDQHTRLIVNVDEFTDVGENPTECLKLDAICPIPGCTDPVAINYDPNATVDDGSCIAPIYGCTDTTPGPYPDITGYCPGLQTSGHTVGTTTSCGGSNGYASVNFDPAANTNAVSATDPSNPCCAKAGCTDPLYCNYDPTACFDDGSCDGLMGCTDELSPDYNSNYDCDCNYTQGGNDFSCCSYLWSCGEAGYGVETCDDPDAEIIPITSTAPAIPSAWATNAGQTHELFETVTFDNNVSGGNGWAQISFKELWYAENWPAGTYSGSPTASNYYGNQNGACIYPATGGTWDKKKHIFKASIPNILPMDPGYWVQQYQGGTTLDYPLFGNTLHIGDPTEAYSQKFLETFMNPANYAQLNSIHSINVGPNNSTGNTPTWPTMTGQADDGWCWDGNNASSDGYGGIANTNLTTGLGDESWSNEMPSLLSIIRTRGFDGNLVQPQYYYYPDSNGCQSTIWIPFVNDPADPTGDWMMIPIAVRMRLDTNAQDITLSQNYDLSIFDIDQEDGSLPSLLGSANTISAGAPPPIINKEWLWEDIVKVLQADWEIVNSPVDITMVAETYSTITNAANVFANPLLMNQVFTPPHTGATALPMGVELIPQNCTCSNWEDCTCEKDPSGTYLTQYDCEHDNNNYLTCCSQAFAPPTTTPPLGNARLANTNYTPPSSTTL